MSRKAWNMMPLVLAFTFTSEAWADETGYKTRETTEPWSGYSQKSRAFVSLPVTGQYLEPAKVSEFRRPGYREVTYDLVVRPSDPLKWVSLANRFSDLAGTIPGIKSPDPSGPPDDRSPTHYTFESYYGSMRLRVLNDGSYGFYRFSPPPDGSGRFRQSDPAGSSMAAALRNRQKSSMAFTVDGRLGLADFPRHTGDFPGERERVPAAARAGLSSMRPVTPAPLPPDRNSGKVSGVQTTQTAVSDNLPVSGGAGSGQSNAIAPTPRWPIPSPTLPSPFDHGYGRGSCGGIGSGGSGFRMPSVPTFHTPSFSTPSMPRSEINGGGKRRSNEADRLISPGRETLAGCPR